MLPKKGDILRLDKTADMMPVRSSRGGGFWTCGNPQSTPEGTLLRFLRTRNESAMVQIINSTSPKVRKMIRTIHPDTNSRQTYSVDAYAVSFHCKRDEFNETMLLG